ncbi:1,4-dihydroxy-2-naphthoate octaprenyltransferase [Croceiramulus getboli]|nr:1,4-dihydroxy-2-naphthoate octaprenyltransferase [Flavobacteriaceae bacterium YJPT1-3]
MAKIKVWIAAARLRTLPLSISGILVGSAKAYETGQFQWDLFLLALLTTLGFQILSNFANDYGDGVKGTDNAERIGPARTLQSGLLSAAELKMGIIVTALLTLLSSLATIYVAFGEDQFILSLIFFLLGLSAILAAIKYTVGRSAYGYRGLGDFFVFIFFGLVGVVGSYFLYTQRLPLHIFLPATAIGCLSVAVLHLNNMRDAMSDVRAGKNTLAVMLGPYKAKWYHSGLLFMAFISLLLYISGLWARLVFILLYLPMVFHLMRVWNNEQPALLDPELKKVALHTFAIALFFVGYAYFNF